MANFLAELKRRNIYRVGAAYAVVAWILLQLVNNVAPAFNLPGTAVMLVIVLLSAGFPIALIFAWVLELKSTNAPSKTSAMDWVLLAVATVFVGMFTYQQLAPSRAIVTAQSDIEAARYAAAKNAGISVAVLPFVNLSSDKEQEYFSDGITEEITSALAKVPDLRVVARTSAFEFKGKNVNIKTIGEQLGATHVIEGSVRKAGERVRITVQLIKADDGTHIWAQDYDRELTDIFAIQEDIGRAITASLNMSLGLKPSENLVSNRKIDPESYQQYLRAKALVRAGGTQPFTEATALLEQVVAHNPDYAPAWALLGFLYVRTPLPQAGPVDEVRRIVNAFVPKAEAAVRRAIQLDPNLPDGYLALGRVQSEHGKSLTAEDLFSKALALDPNNPDALAAYSNLLANVGRLKEALAMKQQLRALEPYVPGYIYDTAEILWLNGQDDAAIAMLKESPSEFTAVVDLARIYAAMGHYSEAADLLLEIPSRVSGFPVEFVVEPARLLRTAPLVSASSQNLSGLGALGFIFLYIGSPGRALEAYEHAAEGGFFAAGGSDDALLWHPSYATLRKTERYKAFIRKSGYVDYWRARGWPDLCRPVGADDFVCD